MIYINFEDVVFTLYYALGVYSITPRDVSMETVEVFAKYWMEYLEKNGINCVYLSNKSSYKTFERDYGDIFSVSKESIKLIRGISYEHIYSEFLENKPKAIYSFMYDPRFMTKVIKLHFESIKKKEIKKAQIYTRS